MISFSFRPALFALKAKRVSVFSSEFADRQHLQFHPTVNTVDMHKSEVFCATARTKPMPVQPHPYTIDVKIVIASQVAMRLHLLANRTFISRQSNILGEVEP